MARATLRLWIWPVYGGLNGPKSTVSVVRKATLEAQPRLFGQSQKVNSRKFVSGRGRPGLYGLGPSSALSPQQQAASCAPGEVPPPALRAPPPAQPLQRR